MIVGISERWQKNAPKLSVDTKKEIFYRFMLPLVARANNMVLDRRKRLQRLDAALAGGGALSPEDNAWLREVAVLLSIVKREKVEQRVDAAMQRSITADTALRLERYFGIEAQFWLNLQSEYDLRVMKRKIGSDIEQRILPVKRIPSGNIPAEA